MTQKSFWGSNFEAKYRDVLKNQFWSYNFTSER